MIYQRTFGASGLKGLNSCKRKNFHTESFPNDYFRVHDSVLYMDHPKDHSLFGLRLPGYEAIEFDDIS